MIFYFVAPRPYIDEAIGDKIYLTLADAVATRVFLNELGIYGKVFQAEAVNIVEVQVQESEP